MPEQRYSPKYSFNRIGLALSLCAVALILAQAIVGNVVYALWPSVAGAWWFRFALTSLFYLVAAPVFWLFVHDVPRGERPVHVSLTPSFFFTALGISLGGMYFFNYVGFFVTQGIARLRGVAVDNPLVSLLDGADPIVVFLLVCVASPVAEELVFRGLLLDRLRPFGDRMAVLFSALAFGLFHMNLSQFFYATAIGLVLGYVTVRTGKRTCAILLHICLNLLGSLVIPYLASVDNLYVRTATGVLVFALIALSALLLFLFCGRIALSPASREPESEIREKSLYLCPGALSYYVVCLFAIMLNLFA